MFSAQFLILAIILIGLANVIPAQSDQTQAEVDSGQHRRFLGSLVNDASGLFNGLAEIDSPIENENDATAITSAKKSSGILGNVQGAVKKFIPL